MVVGEEQARYGKGTTDICRLFPLLDSSSSQGDSSDQINILITLLLNATPITGKQ